MIEVNEEKDIFYMKMALDLSMTSAGYTSPNPMVGAVIVKDGQVLGTGWHECCGELHAERNALADCEARGNDPEGATIYVTLEPCCHYGKTPPCTDAIIENGLSRVVYGALDPNPKVAGKGLEILREAGIQVDGPVLNEECLKVNEIFFHYITTGIPYVIMKYAMTADGKIAAYTGDSRWVTGETARLHTHYTRKKMSAIMVGIRTVLADDPMLNCRLPYKDLKRDGSPYRKSPNPVRVVCDSRLRIPEDSKIAKTAGEIRTIVACLQTVAEGIGENKAARLRSAGMEVVGLPEGEGGHIDISALLKVLGTMKIDSLLVEGGGELNFSVLKTGAVKKIQVYMAPKIIGGAQARSPVAGVGIATMSECIKLENPSITPVGEDILIEYSVKKEETPQQDSRSTAE